MLFINGQNGKNDVSTNQALSPYMWCTKAAGLCFELDALGESLPASWCKDQSGSESLQPAHLLRSLAFN
jgi:hypothetical protein